jgi:hypothetical protein
MYFNLNTLAIPNYGEYNQAYGDGPRAYASRSDERISDANTTGVDAFIAVLGGCDRVPIEVTDLVVSAGDRGVSLSWRLSADAQRELRGVRVQRAEASNGPFVERTSHDLPPTAAMSFDDQDVRPGNTYWYRLQLESTSGTVEFAGPIQITVADAVAHRTALATPIVSADGSVSIRFSLGTAAGAARLEIFDISGRRVKSLAQSLSQPGQYLRTWDRRDESGTEVARGVYVVRLEAGSIGLARKLVLVQD